MLQQYENEMIHLIWLCGKNFITMCVINEPCNNEV